MGKVFEFTPLPSKEHYKATFAVYENDQGKPVVYADGVGEQPDLREMLASALWATLDHPIAVVIVQDNETYMDLDLTDHTREESLEILKETVNTIK